ncbi:hypothetical protein [Coxiella endosymbiont of Ornithodoros maritimus]|uniref:hypothetical protein n=1 Tax=Coxiella endosymbiont of Ornithodoros maritimus TaxID=1656172 RepID=UPI0022655078|nr:hypothetical protein [Coxiella endosymbiont of Ornithodoros maritimus]
MVYPLLHKRFPAFHLAVLEEHRDRFLQMLFRQVGAPSPYQQQDPIQLGNASLLCSFILFLTHA